MSGQAEMPAVVIADTAARLGSAQDAVFAPHGGVEAVIPEAAEASGDLVSGGGLPGHCCAARSDLAC